jgi:hypothetical protein
MKVFLAMAAVLLSAATGYSQKRDAAETIIQGHTLYTVLKPGDIPAVFEPKFIKAIEADKLFYTEEPVLVVSDGDSAHAYSTWHLDAHEIVNDYINGRAITVTW